MLLPRAKSGITHEDGLGNSLADQGHALAFERADDSGKLRLVLNDILSLVTEVNKLIRTFF